PKQRFGTPPTGNPAHGGRGGTPPQNRSVDCGDLSRSRSARGARGISLARISGTFSHSAQGDLQPPRRMTRGRRHQRDKFKEPARLLNRSDFCEHIFQEKEHAS
ncbi:unnamed protein product, partial [Pleuronectes platessa]